MQLRHLIISSGNITLIDQSNCECFNEISVCKKLHGKISQYYKMIPLYKVVVHHATTTYSIKLYLMQFATL